MRFRGIKAVFDIVFGFAVLVFQPARFVVGGDDNRAVEVF